MVKSLNRVTEYLVNQNFWARGGSVNGYRIYLCMCLSYSSVPTNIRTQMASVKELKDLSSAAAFEYCFCFAYLNLVGPGVAEQHYR
jgi:hypothetical protein